MDNHLIIWNNENKNNQQHHFLLPSPSLRALIIGQSGCGKTNLLLRLLLQKNWLDYEDLYIFGKSLHQPEYKLIKAGFDKGYSKNNIMNIFHENKGNIDSFIKELKVNGKSTKNVFYFENAEDVPDPREIKENRKSLFIFDDIMTDKKQNKAEDYYTKGRHNNASSIYIAQNFYKLPRQTIRSNSNLIVLFSLPNKDLQNIHQDIISTDMDWKEFSEFCKDTFNKPHSFIVINRESDIFQGKYQSNFNRVYIPNKYTNFC